MLIDGNAFGNEPANSFPIGTLFVSIDPSSFIGEMEGLYLPGLVLNPFVCVVIIPYIAEALGKGLYSLARFL